MYSIAGLRGKRRVRVLRMRVKDRHAEWLRALAREVNLVWNYCNDLQQRVFDRERKLLSGFDFWPYLRGCTRGECGLAVPAQTVQETAEQYARSRIQQRKVRLAWRKSGGSRRSLGWVPFKVRMLRHEGGGRVYFAGRQLSLWDSWTSGEWGQLRAGSFNEDARGRWYLNVSVEIPELLGPALPKALPAHEIGIDLGLKSLATISDGVSVEAPQFYRDLEGKLANAQRAGKRERTRALHAQIANRRKDFLHKLSTTLVRRSGAIFVGNISAFQLGKGRHAKGVFDAGWSALRTMLRYKCDNAGVWFEVVDEAYSTQTCSRCRSRAGPQGREGLGIREWTCSDCGATHDRDINAARNILAVGHGRLVEGIAAHYSRDDVNFYRRPQAGHCAEAEAAP